MSSNIHHEDPVSLHLSPLDLKCLPKRAQYIATKSEFKTKQCVFSSGMCLIRDSNWQENAFWLQPQCMYLWSLMTCRDVYSMTGIVKFPIFPEKKQKIKYSGQLVCCMCLIKKRQSEVINTFFPLVWHTFCCIRWQCFLANSFLFWQEWFQLQRVRNRSGANRSWHKYLLLWIKATGLSRLLDYKRIVLSLWIYHNT